MKVVEGENVHTNGMILEKLVGVEDKSLWSESNVSWKVGHEMTMRFLAG